jgi:hypothetical protein
MEENILKYPIFEETYIDEKELNQYINMKLDNIIDVKIKKYKGQKYEEYIKNYIILTENIQCWLWKDIPKNELINSKLVTDKKYNEIVNYISELKNGQIKDKNYYKHIINSNQRNPIFDFGVDILAKKNNEYIFIQCKNKETNIFNSTIKSFNYIMIKHPNINGRLYYSNDSKMTNINKLKNIEYINLSYNDLKLNKFINEFTYDVYTDKYLVEKLKYEYHQQKYKESIELYVHLKKKNTCILKDNNDYLYSDLKWQYIFNELDNYIKLNNKLPDHYDIIYDKIKNFINYNDKTINKYTEEWKKYKQIHHNIFTN